MTSSPPGQLPCEGLGNTIAKLLKIAGYNSRLKFNFFFPVSWISIPEQLKTFTLTYPYLYHKLSLCLVTSKVAQDQFRFKSILVQYCSMVGQCDVCIQNGSGYASPNSMLTTSHYDGI